MSPNHVPADQGVELLVRWPLPRRRSSTFAKGLKLIYRSASKRGAGMTARNHA